MGEFLVFAGIAFCIPDNNTLQSSPEQHAKNQTKKHVRYAAETAPRESAFHALVDVALNDPNRAQMAQPMAQVLWLLMHALKQLRPVAPFPLDFPHFAPDLWNIAPLALVRGFTAV